MRMVDKFKRNLGKNRGKAAVLGVLFLTMVAFSIRAVLELRPRNAGAAINSVATSDASENLTANVADAEGRIKESQQLWHHLREAKAGAIDASAAFTFDASKYPPLPPDLTHPMPVAPETSEVKPQPVAPVIDLEALKAARIRKEAKALIVKSTVVGNDITAPMTIINQQLLKVGQSVLGFEITAIREREVEFTKEGVLTTIKMPDRQ